MEPDLSGLDDRLAEADADGFLLDASAETADQRYLSGFDAKDPFVTLYASGTTALLVSGLEYARAKAESRADEVRRYADYDASEKREEHGQEAASRLVLAEFLEEFGVASVLTNRRFPLATADDLRTEDADVAPDREDALGDVRAVKTDEEVARVRAAQRANEDALRAAEDVLAAATVDGDGVLHHEGEVVTSERLKAVIEGALLADGYALDDTIVACGADGAVPHNTGSGPIEAHEPIVIDVFPRDKATHYHSDMTRTFVKGEPSPEAREFYDLTREAFDAAMDALGPGVTGATVHGAVCDVYEDAGFPTLRSDPRTETGYIHSTGHGVGLDVHEGPSLSERADDPLEPGNVVTIEPGLYDPEVGGVRLEDIAVVTADGHEDLTDYPFEFEV